MVRRSTSPAEEPARLTPEKMRSGVTLLQKRIGEIKAFDTQKVTDQYDIPEIARLSAAIDDCLVRTFGANTSEYSRYSDANHFNSGPHYDGVSIHEVRQSLDRSKGRSIALLEQALQSLEEQLAEVETASLMSSPQRQRTPHSGPYRKVFIVHGQDDGTKESVARFVEKLGLEAIILHERPNKGRTIITKFREEAEDVGLAVVLMTPDDVGKAASASDLKPRARQNVVFELGFFIGALRPARVVAMVKGDLERPTDFDGVVYISLDQVDWRTKLAAELKAAGLDGDWTKVLP